MTSSIITYAVALAVCLWALRLEIRRDLMMLQQNSYRNERYRRWLSASSDSTSAWRLCGIVIFFIALSPFAPSIAGVVMAGTFALFRGYSLAKARYKKPLAVTNRVKRLMGASYLISLLVIAGAAFAFSRGCDTAAQTWARALAAGVTAALGCYCGSHIVVVLANIVLSPVEKAINRRYYRDAANRIAAMPELKIIGVTGSYGKTTTKHYLHRILSEKYETLMTPGSYNTTLGVVRTIREMLKPYHEVFIVEMGAKARGDIKEICDLVHPRYGLITAVGPQHLESFKTIENVRDTKFELADALPADGLAVVNNDFEQIAGRSVDNVRCIRYAVKNTENADYVAEDINYSPAGTTFTAVDRVNGSRLVLTTRLVGECNISNLLGAVAMARHLGVEDDMIRHAVERIEQVEHRLSIRRTPSGMTIIDDAFNSNPVGSAMALDVLAAMTPGKRILITPGMIELGERQYELNEALGKKAAGCCDIAIVVGHYNRDAIVSGLEKGGMAADAVRVAASFAEAQAMLSKIAGAGDAILYENDLPDTFK